MQREPLTVFLDWFEAWQLSMKGGQGSGPPLGNQNARKYPEGKPFGPETRQILQQMRTIDMNLQHQFMTEDEVDRRNREEKLTPEQRVARAKVFDSIENEVRRVMKDLRTVLLKPEGRDTTAPFPFPGKDPAVVIRTARDDELEKRFREQTAGKTLSAKEQGQLRSKLRGELKRELEDFSIAVAKHLVLGGDWKKFKDRPRWLLSDAVFPQLGPKGNFNGQPTAPQGNIRWSALHVAVPPITDEELEQWMHRSDKHLFHPIGQDKRDRR